MGRTHGAGRPAAAMKAQMERDRRGRGVARPEIERSAPRTIAARPETADPGPRGGDARRRTAAPADAETIAARPAGDRPEIRRRAARTCSRTAPGSADGPPERQCRGRWTCRGAGRPDGAARGGSSDIRGSGPPRRSREGSSSGGVAGGRDRRRRGKPPCPADAPGARPTPDRIRTSARDRRRTAGLTLEGLHLRSDACPNAWRSRGPAAARVSRLRTKHLQALGRQRTASCVSPAADRSPSAPGARPMPGGRPEGPGGLVRAPRASPGARSPPRCVRHGTVPDRRVHDLDRGWDEVGGPHPPPRPGRGPTALRRPLRAEGAACVVGRERAGGRASPSRRPRRRARRRGDRPRDVPWRPRPVRLGARGARERFPGTRLGGPSHRLRRPGRPGLTPGRRGQGRRAGGPSRHAARHAPRPRALNGRAGRSSRPRALPRRAHPGAFERPGGSVPRARARRARPPPSREGPIPRGGASSVRRTSGNRPAHDRHGHRDRRAGRRPARPAAAPRASTGMPSGAARARAGAGGGPLRASRAPTAR